MWERGIYQNEIIPLAKLSRQAVYNHLKKLTEEGRIMKSRGMYVVTQTDDDIFFILMFEAHLDRWLKKMFTPNAKRKRDNSMFVTRNGENAEIVEKNISDFANIIGAFIIYVLLVSKMPILERTVEDEKREYLIRDVVQGPIFLENILYGFSNFLLGIAQKEPYEVLNKKVYDNFINAFMKVFPNLYADLEQQWKTFAHRFFHEPLQSTQKSIEEDKDCKHKMEKRYMFNFGDYLECNICHIRSPLNKF